MSKVAILSPGPSLKQYPGRSGYDLLIGVNRVVSAIECDWWSAMDILMVTEEMPFGQPRLFTIMDTETSIPPLIKLRRFKEILTHEEMTINPGTGWNIFSAPAALMLALHLGATSIDAWGCDMEGTSDWDGLNDIPYSRHNERWIRERAIWIKTTEFIRSYGVSVVRKGV